MDEADAFLRKRNEVIYKQLNPRPELLRLRATVFAHYLFMSYAYSKGCVSYGAVILYCVLKVKSIVTW